ncbi:MAG: lysophospholipid acyltransferase family protein [candidate division WOR-3 bacterium]
MRNKPLTWLFPLGTLIQFVLPRWLVVRIALCAGFLAYHINRRQRHRLIENYRHIFGASAPEKLLKQTTLQAFKNISVFYADLLRVPVLKKRVVQLADFNSATFDQVLAKGIGVILVTGHIGNWDLAGVFLTALGYPISAVVEPVPGGWMKTFNRYRSVCAMETIPLTEREQIKNALERRRVLALVADRDLTKKGILCPAFDAQRSFPKGPAVYSLRYNVPIVLGYFVRQDRTNHPPYLGVIEEPFDFHPTGNLEDDIVNLTRLIAQRINEIIRRYPDQWLVFKAEWQ